MATKVLDKSKTTTVKDLQNEVALLRSFVIGQAGRDPEGEYRPEFAKRILKSAMNNKTEHVFKDRKSFLNYLNGHKD